MTGQRAGVSVHWLGRLGFDRALEMQELHVREHANRGDTILLLEHDPVYTTSRRGKDENLPDARYGAEVRRIGRGGDVTYHGPGQLVGYVLFDLRARGGDVHRFLRAMEAGVIDLLRDLGVQGDRIEQRTGVWVRASPGDPLGPRKIASIGIGVRRGISMHGFALNVSTDLAAFDAIVPCDLTGVRMTSVATETGRTPPPLQRVAERAGPILLAAFGPAESQRLRA